MLWFGPGKIAYKFTNQSSKYTNGTFQLKSPNWPGEFFYLSIIVERFTMYNLVVLYLWLPRIFVLSLVNTILYDRLKPVFSSAVQILHQPAPGSEGDGSFNNLISQKIVIIGKNYFYFVYRSVWVRSTIWPRICAYYCLTEYPQEVYFYFHYILSILIK